MTSSEFVTYLLRFRLNMDAERRFSHTVYVNGLLSQLICHPLPNLHDDPPPPWIVIPNPVESGGVRYLNGDLYHVGITFVGQGYPQLTDLRDMINSKIEECVKNPAAVPLGVRLVDIIPAVPANIDEQTEVVNTLNRLTLQFVTPLGIEQRFLDGASRHFDRDYFDPSHFFKMLGRRIYDISRLGPADPGPLADKPTPDVKLVSNRLVWLRVPSPGDKPDAPQYYGAVGKVVLEGPFAGWEGDLVQGQYFHVGRSLNFGFGRYVIRELDSIRRGDVRPARSFISFASAGEELRAAWEIVKSRGGWAGSDGETIDDFESDLGANLDALGAVITTGRYLPPALMGIVTESEDGKPRALAVPTVSDRVAQRSAVQALGPSIGKLLEDCSYAYRKGYSRFNAAGVIEQAYRDGYRYALRADIESFFDSVDWEWLGDKLDALFPYERLIDLIMRWVKSPVMYQGRTIHRCQGLPQGAPISPLPANLYLDEFNKEMDEFGFRLARYGEGYIILCKSALRAREAVETAQQRLADLTTKPDSDKTPGAEFRYGFRYLAYLFGESAALGSPAASPDYGRATTSDETIIDTLAKSEWLASLDVKTLVPIEEDMRTGRYDVPSLAPKTEDLVDTIYIVVYNIPDEKIRNRVAQFLETKGTRVQESVFECRRRPGGAKALAESIKRILGKAEGNIRIYLQRFS